MRPVIYLTGPPAAGKSTLCRKVVEQLPETLVLHYSELLRDHLAQIGSVTTEDGIRRSSAKIITPQMISDVDELLIQKVQQERCRRPIIIDSHAVTKESYGFRITPFTLEKLRLLSPTHVCLLFADSDTTIRRINENAQGRPLITPFEANFHLYLQSQVAVSYCIELGLQLYILDSTATLGPGLDKLLSLLK
jgi:adenylate kinase